MSGIGEFLEAIERGDLETVSAMVRDTPELVRCAGEHAKTGLHLAAEFDQVEVARILVDAGADIEAKTSWGATPFDWAATTGSSRVADLLLSRGASGLSLITAAALGKQDDVESMVESERDLSSHRRRGAPSDPDDEWPSDSAHMRGDILSDALYAAARNGHRAVVKYLLAHGADVDAKGFFGAPALHWAAFNGHERVVDLLIERGANPALTDCRFHATAEAWADEAGHARIAETLRRARPGD